MSQYDAYEKKNDYNDTKISPSLQPSTIELARRLERMTQKRLSELTGISQGKISKLQNGFISFTAQDAAKIAKALDYPLSFFTLTRDVPPMTALTYRKRSRSSAAELSAVSIEFASLCYAVRRLREKLSMRDCTAWIRALAPTKSSPLDVETIDHIAAEARKHLGIEQTGAVHNVTRSLERTGIVTAPLHSPAVSVESPVNSGGVCHPTDNSVCIGYADSASISGDRLRFTKAHELGHLILHTRRRPSTPQQTEREANLFAGALLLPAIDAHATLNQQSTLMQMAQIKAGWGISIAAIIQRAYALSIIDQHRYQSLQIQLSSRGWRINEPVAVGKEEPLLFKQMIEACYAVNGYDTTPKIDKPINAIKAAEELRIPFRFLDQWAHGLTEEGREMGLIENRFANER